MGVRRIVVAGGAAAALLAATGMFGAQPAAAAVTCPTMSGGTPSIPATPGVNWSGCNLKGLGLPEDQNYDDPNSGANLANVNFSGANLVGSSLAFANLTGANLAGANLNGSLLYGVNMTNANLRGANLTFTTLTGDTRLRNADVTGAIFVKKDPQKAAFICGTPGKTVLFRTRGVPKSLPPGWKMQKGQILAVQVECDDGVPVLSTG